jgi:hypothetical protein
MALGTSHMAAPHVHVWRFQRKRLALALAVDSISSCAGPQAAYSAIPLPPANRGRYHGTCAKTPTLPRIGTLDFARLPASRPGVRIACLDEAISAH